MEEMVGFELGRDEAAIREKHNQTSGQARR